MIRIVSLRDRLALSFAVALALSYALFALVTLVVFGRATDAGIDAQLQSVLAASRAVADEPRLRDLDHKDQVQFANIAAGLAGYVAVRQDGSMAIGVRDGLPAWANGRRGAFTVRDPQTHVRLRALVEPIAPADPESATIVTWQSLALFDRLRNTLAVGFAVVGAVVAIASYVLAAYLVRRGLRPLTALAQFAAEIEAHDLSLRVGDQRADDEVGRLAATFDRMLDRLEAAFDRQRRFTADASHDLRAPLAALRAEADLALLRERSVDDYRAALTNIVADADRIDALVDALLAAARADAAGFNPHPVDLAGIAAQTIAHIEPFARARGIALDVAAQDGVTIVADGMLLERAMAGVLHNAVRHTPPGGTVNVHVVRENGLAALRVHDGGGGFSGDALHSAFERFWRDDPARRGDGAGLGLTIAKAVVERCGGTIALANATAGGGVVSATFPAVSASAG
jgi:signal transduction histidine kinase